MGKTLNLKGKKFGKLTVLSLNKTDKYTYWDCLCECGNTKIIRGNNLVRDVESCGCLREKNLKKIITTHGMTDSRPYTIWEGIIQRTTNPKNKAYKNYGGRGIIVCKKWLKFDNFWKDMRKGYVDNLSIDRINNNEGYEPANCRWATMKEQQNNKRPYAKRR